MPKIKLQTLNLDALLDDVDEMNDPESTNRPEALSDTNLSSTKGWYMNRWKKENRDTLRIDLPKGEKAILQAEAAKRSLSATKMIKSAIEEFLVNHPVD